MPDFAYVAKSGPKETIRGNVTALTRQEAVRLIEQKGLVPIEVLEGSAIANPAAGASSEALPSPPRRPRRIRVHDVCVFTRQIAGFIRSQVPILSALEYIRAQTPADSGLHPLITRVALDVRDGRRFSEALEAHGGAAFDARYLSLIRSGETGGSLDQILETLADALETEEEMRGQIRAALAYPLFVAVVGVATVFFLFLFCIPKLSGLFGQTFDTLPLPTKILMTLARPVWQALFVAALAALGGVGVYFALGGERRRRPLGRLVSRLPFIGPALLKADIARFSATLAMLLENGIPIYQALEVTKPVLSTDALRGDLAAAPARIIGGDMLAAVLRDARNFPPFVAQMVAVGEDGGRLPQSLKELSRFYSRESLRAIKTATSLIEPIFILALSVVVGFVVGGIMLPIFDMNWVQ